MKHIFIKETRGRDNRGAAIITLSLCLFLITLFIVFFVFDMNRLQMAQRQLVSLCDSAALAGTAMLTSHDTSYENSTLQTLYNVQLAAVQYAKNMVAMGNILGQQLYDPSLSSAPSGDPVKINFVASQAAVANAPAGTANVAVLLASPINNYAIIPAGNSSGRALLVQASYGYIPFLHVLGVKSVQVPSCSTGSLQKLYVIMVFDCSGSMDDNTTVSFVYRRWTDSSDTAAQKATNGGKGEYIYTVVGTPGNGQLWQYAGLDYTNEPNGTAVNILYPQNLDYLGFVYGNTAYTYANSNTSFANASPPLAFDIAIANYVPWPAGTITGAWNAGRVSYPIANPASGFQGPYYDNYFGTPPGNCTVKYGTAPSGAIWGGQTGTQVTNANYSLNAVNTITSSAQLPGPGYSPGYYYYLPPSYGPNATLSNNNSDGNIYFYDPNSMPARSTSNKVVAFTDLVANIVQVTPPVTQPMTTPTTFSGFSETFSGSSSTYTVAIAETTSANLTENGTYELNPTLEGQVYAFTNLAYVIEAARGNLDYEWNATAVVASTYTNYYNALLAYGSNLGTIPNTACKGGYQAAYMRLAMYAMQPYATAVDGATRFFQNLCQTSCVNFGFVGFSVAPATTSNYVCAYGSKTLGTGNSGTTSVFLGAPANTYKPTAVYSSWIYQPLAGCNPCFWVSDTCCSPSGAGTTLPAGPSGSPSGECYIATYNTTGPTRATWLKVNGGSPPSNATTLWANNYPGFCIPRYPLLSTNTQGQAFYAVAGDDWSGANLTNNGNTAGGDVGCNGVKKAIPLYETASREALEYALYNLTKISSLTSLTGSQGGTSGLALPADYGAKKAICFFTDGIPTDDNSPYSTYTTDIVTPATNAGVTLYSVGLALNSNIQTEQAAFLASLSNKGACGSQYFQITNSASLDATFTGIARQLADCGR